MIRPGYLFIPNKVIQARLANRLAKRFQFVPGAFGDQFHAAAGQITDYAGHVEAGGDRFDGVAEADTLHVARVKNLYSSAIHSIDPNQCATVCPFPGGKSPRRRF